MFVLRNAVGDDDCLEACVVDPLNRRPAEDAVGQDGVDLGGASLHQLVGSQANGPATARKRKKLPITAQALFP